MTRRAEWVYAWLLVLPAAALLALFTHYPAIATAWGSFRSTPKGARPSVYVGLDNYRQLAAAMRVKPVINQARGGGSRRGGADGGGGGGGGGGGVVIMLPDYRGFGGGYAG